MSSKFDALFFERYIRGECSDLERSAFESALSSDPVLKQEFEKNVSYFTALRSLPPVVPSDDFTDRVVREIRLRAERKFSFARITKGLFSREVLGVVTAAVVLAFLFKTQMLNIANSFAPQKIADYSLESAPAAEDQPAESAVDQREIEKNAAPAERTAESAVQTAASAEVQAEKADETGISVLKDQPAAAAPAVEAERFSQPKEEVFAEISEEMKAAPVLQMSSSDEFAKGRAAESPELNVLAKKSKTAVGFPFADFEAAAVQGDTTAVTLPRKQLKRFISAWKKYGGTVLDTVRIDDTSAVIRILQPGNDA